MTQTYAPLSREELEYIAQALEKFPNSGHSDRQVRRLLSTIEDRDRQIAALTPQEGDVAEARAHLGAALVQTISSDDQIIMDHVRKAYELLGGKP